MSFIYNGTLGKWIQQMASRIKYLQINCKSGRKGRNYSKLSKKDGFWRDYNIIQGLDKCLKALRKIKFEYVIVDEAHRMKNIET